MWCGDAFMYYLQYIDLVANFIAAPNDTIESVKARLYTV